jgi:acetate kinase
MASHVILCLNSGSSSLKFALYQIGDGEEILLAQGAVERNDAKVARLWIHSAQRKIEKTSGDISSTSAALRTASIELERLQVPHPDAVGHRLVHGGPHHAVPERITDTLLNELRSLIAFAPLHLPDEIAGIEAVTSHFSSLPQVACFDTAFHRSMPEVAQRFALPRALWGEGIRR